MPKDPAVARPVAGRFDKRKAHIALEKLVIARGTLVNCTHAMGGNSLALNSTAIRQALLQAVSEMDEALNDLRAIVG